MGAESAFAGRGQELEGTHEESREVDKVLALARAERRELEPTRARDEEDPPGVTPTQRDAARVCELGHGRRGG